MTKKLSKLAIAASAAMLLGSCHEEYYALRDFQRKAIQTKLEQMAPEAADGYIRQQMDGVQRFRREKFTRYVPSMDGLVPVFEHKWVNDGLYLDLWAKEDTNGTFIDEYVDYVMNNAKAERETKIQAESEFAAKQRQAKIDNLIK